MDNIEQLFVEINEVSNNLVDQMDEIKADYLLTKINNDDDLFHDLYEYSLNLLNTYIDDCPLDFAEENFDALLHNSCQSLLNITIYEIFKNDKYNETILDIVSDDILNKVYKEFYNNFIPRRSYEKTFIRKNISLDIIGDKIELIRNKPQPDQRTKEWYTFRHNLITASSAGKVFESQSSINQLIFEKCSPIVDRSNRFVNTSSPLHWGQKYEPVSTMFYEYKYKTTVEDYGCIQHDKYSFLGASPDGINIDRNNELYGRMLEIKNVVNREITGIPKKMYWIQMQLQMETCNLNECDFLECQFKEYENETEFKKDGTFKYTENEQLKGIILHFEVDYKPVYEYMPIGMNETDFEEWRNSHMTKYDKFIKTIYWKLDYYSCILVLRNTLWFKNAILEIEKVWNIIEDEKKTGYEHRAPKKRKKRENSIDNQSCLIDFNQLDNDDNNDNIECLFDVDLNIIDDTAQDSENNVDKFEEIQKSEQNNTTHNTHNTIPNNDSPKILRIRTLSIDETNIDNINIDNINIDNINVKID
tara:strand:+ start:800 stop:2392 length:1593 start_codon:yes stop_codon:yes gene_type:complete